MASSTISPNVGIASRSGLELDPTNGGIVVNDTFESCNGVYAAGSCASYFDSTLGRRRVNRYDHSVNSGLLAGYNMVSSTDDGTQKGYVHQPAVRSYLGDINVSCESIGECNSDLSTVGVWISTRNAEGKDLLGDVSCMSPYKRGIVYYLRSNKVVGVVLWNSGDLLERARDLIRLNPDVNPSSLKRCIPLAPDDWLIVKEEKGRMKSSKLTVEDDREHLVQVRAKEFGDGGRGRTGMRS